MATASGLFGSLCEAQRQAIATATDITSSGVDAQRQTADAVAVTADAAAAVGAAGVPTTRAAADVATATTPLLDDSLERLDRRLDAAAAAEMALFEAGGVLAERSADTVDALNESTRDTAETCSDAALATHEAGETTAGAVTARLCETAAIMAIVAAVDGIDLIDRPDERFEDLAVDGVPDA